MTDTTYKDTVDHFAEVAAKRAKSLKQNPFGFFIGTLMAGAYIGFGIILIFVLGSDADPASRKLIMGAAFGIALTLVVFADLSCSPATRCTCRLAGFGKRQAV